MTKTVHIVYTTILLAVFMFSFAASRAEVLPDPGSMTLLSKDLVAGVEGELLLRYTAGSEALPKGSRIWVELPAIWYNKIGCSRLDTGLEWQYMDARADGYFAALHTPQGVTVKYDKGTNADIWGVGNRFVQVFSFQIRGRDLETGQNIDLVFRHHLNGGSAFTPGVVGSGPVRWMVVSPDQKLPRLNPVQVLTDPGLPREYRVESLWLEIVAGRPASLEATLPSRAAASETVILKVRLLDTFYNLCRDTQIPIRLSAQGPVKYMPAEIYPAQDGVARAEITFSGPGVVKVTAHTQGLESVSNPLEVSGSLPASRIYWGDIHSHSQWSNDGMGVKPFDYARDASALDFYALTEHVRHISPDEWTAIQNKVAQYNRPGSFATILAFEDSAIQPSGHFNLYFKQAGAAIRIPEQLDELPAMYGGLDPLVIQHHPGIQWQVDLGIFNFLVCAFNRLLGPQVEWAAFPEVPRSAVEIYSLHGSSEVYGPHDALSYENCDLTLPRGGREVGPCRTGTSLAGSHYVRDGWAAGYVMGTVAGSDDHRAQPGRRGGGLTAVMAADLSRDAVWRAIDERRTYATTGERIILDFSVNGKPMGSLIEPATEIDIKIKALGTDTIKELIVLGYDWQTEEWLRVVEIHPDRAFVEVQKVLPSRSPAMYYVRLEQVSPVNGRPVRAWSSPIWVGRPPEPGK